MKVAREVARESEHDYLLLVLAQIPGEVVNFLLNWNLYVPAVQFFWDHEVLCYFYDV